MEGESPTLIVADYQTWVGKLQFFLIYQLLNSLLSNITDDGDNNEKTKSLKAPVGILKNMVGNILGGDFLGGNFPGRNYMGGNFPGWSFPVTY